MAGEDELFGGSSSGKTRRKEQQLGRQIQEAVGEMLASLRDDVLQDVWVEAVEPAPDASRFMVVLRAPGHCDPDDVLSRVTRAAGALRASVAESITRKRAPGLAYRIVPEKVQP